MPTAHLQSVLSPVR